MVVFGAGASYGSGQVNPKPPPMASELMRDLERLFPTTWGALLAEVRALLNEDFEAGMRSLGETRPDTLPPLQRQLASFFFGFTPGESNLYRYLARRIVSHEWNGALVTLNYERLLELSLGLEGVHSHAGPPAGNGFSVELCLPHGCCHIFCEGVRGLAEAVTFSGTMVETGGTPKPISDPREFHRRIRDDAFPPVMSYFDPTKHTTSCANFIHEQRARYTELVTDATVVAIVGVNVRPNDKHLWQALCDTQADIVYCSGASAGDVFEEWARTTRAGKVSDVLRTYFDESLDNLCERIEL